VLHVQRDLRVKLSGFLSPHIKRLNLSNADEPHESASAFRGDYVRIARHRITRAKYSNSLTAERTLKTHTNDFVRHGCAPFSESLNEVFANFLM
jgi:hypothetical protein